MKAPSMGRRLRRARNVIRQWDRVSEVLKHPAGMLPADKVTRERYLRARALITAHILTK